jgi:hypothetical protein
VAADLLTYLQAHPSHEPVVIGHRREMLKTLRALYETTH